MAWSGDTSKLPRELGMQIAKLSGAVGYWSTGYGRHADLDDKLDDLWDISTDVTVYGDVLGGLLYHQARMPDHARRWAPEIALLKEAAGEQWPEVEAVAQVKLAYLLAKDADYEPGTARLG